MSSSPYEDLHELLYTAVWGISFLFLVVTEDGNTSPAAASAACIVFSVMVMAVALEFGMAWILSREMRTHLMEIHVLLLLCILASDDDDVIIKKK